jgi:two-component system OmpR family sensor kinase/two-component system sensor histidine kinase BaeS
MFLRKVGMLLAFLALVIFVIPWLVLGFIFGFDIPEKETRGGPPGQVIGMAILALVVIGFWILRSLRRTGTAVADVMDAAERVALGSYDVRVAEQGSGEVRQLVKSFNEMTSRLQANESQRRAMQADIAHELRTPLSVIRGTIEGIIDGVYPNDGAHLEPLLEKTAVMTELLEDLQTLSLADAGALRLHRDQTNLRDLVHGVVASFRPEAQLRQIELTAVAPPDLEVEIDPLRIHQVLANLVRNALRHTPDRTAIRIEVRALASAVEFAVSDTGPGIDAQDLPYIFDRFTKSADSGGSGLGLAIAKRLVEAHDGHIEAISTPGTGTTIRFTLPVQQVSFRA